MESGESQRIEGKGARQTKHHVIAAVKVPFGEIESYLLPIVGAAVPPPVEGMVVG
jgi:hypothetical protein